MNITEDGTTKLWKAATLILAGALLSMVGLWGSRLTNDADNAAQIRTLTEQVGAERGEISDLTDAVHKLEVTVATLGARFDDRFGPQSKAVNP